MSIIELGRLQVEIGDTIIGAGTDVKIASIHGLGTGRLASREYDSPNEDGTQFGREHRSGRVLDIAAAIVLPGNEAGAWNVSETLQAIFDADPLRRTPRAVMPLRINRPGTATRVVFGRPDQYEPDIDLAVVGLIPFTASFRTTDNRFYADEEQAIRLSLSSVSAGGLVTDASGNLASPISTVAGARRTSLVENGGDADAWPVITISGPITNPRVTLIDTEGGVLWRLGVGGALAYDQQAVIDTRPWSRGASLSTGSSLAGRLTLDSVPSQSVIPPGVWEIVVEGADESGTSTFDVRWRNAYRGI